MKTAIVIAAILFMGICALIDVIRSRGESVIGWGVLFGSAGLLYGQLG